MISGRYKNTMLEEDTLLIIVTGDRKQVLHRDAIFLLIFNKTTQ